MKVGNPRNSEVKVGPVVNKAQQSACLDGLKKLSAECSVLFGGNEDFQPVDADPQKSAFVQPTLLSCENGLSRSEERRVGKECRYRRSRDHEEIDQRIDK